jgi:hypothetical protein
MLRDWLLQRFGQRTRARARAHRPRRLRCLHTEMDSLEGRALLAATSAISWSISNASHSALYAIAVNDSVEVSVDGGGFTNLGGYAKQISAGLNGFNEGPEVYAIGQNSAAWSDTGSGWVDLGGSFKEISASVGNLVYAIGTNDDIYVGHGGQPSSERFDTGVQAEQISAGAYEDGNAIVYAIGFNNNVYAGFGSGSFTNLGGYAKQISAASNGVYAIGADNAVYEDSNFSGWVDLGGYAKQISAGVYTVSGFPSDEVFAIGLNDALWSNSGSSWVDLGGYFTDVSAPPVGWSGLSLPSVVYAVGKSHGGYLHEGSGFTSLGGYIQTPSGATTDNTNSWEPATRDSSAISWASGDVTQTALYVIGPYNNVEVSVDGGSYANLGFYAKQVSAGFDNATNKPEVYAIGADDAVWVDQGSGWVSLGIYTKQISATDDNTVYAITQYDTVWVNRSNTQNGWVNLGSYAQQISAGTDFPGGEPLVFAIGESNEVLVNRSNTDTGWVNLGGYAKQISATDNGGEQVVYAIGENNAVYENDAAGGGWIDLGGYAEQISASATSSLGPSVVYAIGVNNALSSNEGSGWVDLSGYVTEVCAAAAGNSGIELPAGLVYVVGQGHEAFLHKGTSYSPIPPGGTVE